MGRLEKIVVLTVLFLVAVVLGVALTPSGDSTVRGQKGGPVAAADDAQNQLDATAIKSQPDGLLSAEVDTSTRGSSPAPSVADPKIVAPVEPHDALIKGGASAVFPVNPTLTTKVVEPEKYMLTTEGLKPSGVTDMMFYTWKQGDNFAALALHFYGSKDKVTRLQKANEGRTEASMKADDVLWMPISDSSQAAAPVEGNKIYVVKSGDVLSGISQQFYGTSKKWQKILDANRDTLSAPEKLKAGMRLRIPE